MARGSISHIEFPADDTERARRLYGAVAGWQFGAMEGLEPVKPARTTKKG